jgi:hypothetical protein
LKLDPKFIPPMPPMFMLGIEPGGGIKAAMPEPTMLGNIKPSNPIGSMIA